MLPLIHGLTGTVVYNNTRTCPALVPAPSFVIAPMATLLPSDDNETERPDWSYSASPSISLPN